MFWKSVLTLLPIQSGRPATIPFLRFTLLDPHARRSRGPQASGDVSEFPRYKGRVVDDYYSGLWNRSIKAA